MAGNMKAVKLRIKSIQNTMQITKAMELVASSKLGRAKEKAEACRPCFQELQKILMDIVKNNGDISSDYVRKEKGMAFQKEKEYGEKVPKQSGKRYCYVIIAGDRGLAGGYNGNLFKLLEADMKNTSKVMVADTGNKDEVITADIGKQSVVALPVGKKAVEYCERKKIPCETKDYGEAASISMESCYEMGQLLCRGYKEERFDHIKLCYTDFVSMMSQQPRIISVLPLNDLIDRQMSMDESDAKEDFKEGNRLQKEDRAVGKSRNLILYEPNGGEVFERIVPDYVAGVIYGAVCESLASELAARRMAMESATENAKEMIEKLSLSYNRARQAGITQELTEIVAGAEV